MATKISIKNETTKFIFKKSYIYPIFIENIIFIVKILTMGRPKLNSEEKKSKLGITIDKDIKLKIDKVTNNKSKFIQELIIEFFKQK